MRRSKTITIAEAIDDYINETGLRKKFDEMSLIGSWEEIVGKAISLRTSKIYIKDHTLYVHLTSSVVRNELHMFRDMLKNKLNEKARKLIITEIVLR